MLIYAFFIIPVLFLIGLLLSSVILVRQAETIVIERLGRFHQILGPGLHIIVPFLDQKRGAIWTFVHVDRNNDYYRVIRNVYRIDLREALYDFPKQNVITKDNVTMEINALLYYQITDVKAAMYEVSNLPEAIEKLTQTTLRNVIGSMDLDTSLTSRDAINDKLRLILDEATDKWGVKVNRVELQEVNPPHDIRAAMEKQMRAERSRRATILEAEGSKFAMILDAEGVKESQVLRAQGQAEAAILEAEGQAQSRLKVAAAEAKAFEMLQSAMPNTDPAQYLIAMKYMQALPQMMEGQNNKLIVIPYESSALMGSLASMKELFKNIEEPVKK
jgi:regulator of protease activity HflC (stomatin/prohibitin superfamily)